MRLQTRTPPLQANRGPRARAWAPPRDAPARVHTDTHTHARNTDRHGESVGPGPFLSRGTLFYPVPQAGQGPLCWLTGFSCWVTACRSSRQSGPRWGGVTAQAAPPGPLTCPEKGPPKASPSSPLPPGHLGSTSGRHDRSSVVTNGHKRSRYHLVPRLGQIGCV